MFILFYYALLCVHSSFAIILKRKLVALLLLSYRSFVTINVLWLFLMVPSVCLLCVILVFPDHTHLLFNKDLEESRVKSCIIFTLTIFFSFFSESVRQIQL